MPIDYSHWKKLDVSDDEDEKVEYFGKMPVLRLNQNSPMLKRAQADRDDKEKIKLHRDLEMIQFDLDELTKRMETESDQAECEKVSARMEQLRAQEKETEEKIKAIEERLQASEKKLGHTGFSKTQITKSHPFVSHFPQGDPKAETEKFYVDNKTLIDKFAMLDSLEETQTFLRQYHHLCCNDTAVILATRSLHFLAEGKREQVVNVVNEQVVKQATILNFLLEMASGMKCSPSTLIDGVMEKMIKSQKMYGQPYPGFKRDYCAYMAILFEQLKKGLAEGVKPEEQDEEKVGSVEVEKIETTEVDVPKGTEE